MPADDINAFLDAAEAATPAEPAADATPAEPAPAAEAAPAEAAAPTPPADPANDPDWFDRKYVEDLRQENARYRTRAQRYDEAFQGLPDEVQDGFLDLARQVQHDPANAGKSMLQIAAELMGGATPQPEEFDPFDRNTIEQMIEAKAADVYEKRTAEQQKAAEIDGFHTAVRDLGYEPDSLEGLSVLFLAANQTGGDIAKANEAYKAQQQKAVDDFLARKEQEANESPSPTPQIGTAPSGDTPITNLTQSRAALEAFLDAQGMR